MRMLTETEGCIRRILTEIKREIKAKADKSRLKVIIAETG